MSKRSLTFRLDEQLALKMDDWLSKNSEVSQSQLCNLAIKHFISQDHTMTLEKVELVPATPEEVEEATNLMMKEHKAALDRLK